MRRCATCSASPGAIVADLLMQLLGLAAVVLVLPIAVWGWRLVTHRPLDRERCALLALGRRRAARRELRRLPAAHRAWPLPTGLGGVIGDALLRLPVLLAGDACPA